LQAAYLIELKWANSVSQSLWYSGLEISYKHLSTPHTHTLTAGLQTSKLLLINKGGFPWAVSPYHNFLFLLFHPVHPCIQHTKFDMEHTLGLCITAELKTDKTTLPTGPFQTPPLHMLSWRWQRCKWS